MGSSRYEDMVEAGSEFIYRLKDDCVVVTSEFNSNYSPGEIGCEGLAKVMEQFDIKSMGMVRNGSLGMFSEFYFRNDSYPMKSDESPNMSLKVMPESCQVELILATEKLSGMAGIQHQSYQGMRIADAAMYLYEAVRHLEQVNNYPHI